MPGPSSTLTAPRDLHVGPLGKHRVEVRRHDEARTRGVARAVAEHVPGAVDADVLQPELRELALRAPRRAPLP